MIICVQRSNPQSPRRLRIVPPTSPEAEMMELLSLKAQNTAMPMSRLTLCQLENHRPARIGPILPMSQGPTQVAVTSNPTDRVLATATCEEVYPVESRYVTICPEKERTVRYSSAPANEGMKAACVKYSFISWTTFRVAATARSERTTALLG